MMSYDEYARPQSRRDIPSRGDDSLSFERPKTSRGHRNAAEEHYIEQENSEINQNHSQPSQQPILRRSNKRSVFSSAQTLNEAERPHTGMGFYEPSSTPNDLSPTHKEGNQQLITKKDRPASGYFVSPKTERPKTGYGRRNSETPRPASVYSSEQGRPESRREVSPEMQPRPTTAMRRARPKSAKGRPRPNYGNVSQPHTPDTYTPRRERSFSASDTFNPEISPDVSPRQHTSVSSPSHFQRPTSSLSLNKYSPLPSIGHKQTPSTPESLGGLRRETTFINDDTSSSLSHAIDSQLKLSSKPTSFKEAINFEPAVKTEQDPLTESKLKPLTRQITLPPEPADDEEALTLAVKLPDGQRVQQRFGLNQNIQAVIHFAEHTAQLDFSGFQLVTNSVPKRQFDNMLLSLRECNLEDRTLFHLQTPDNA